MELKLRTPLARAVLVTDISDRSRFSATANTVGVCFKLCDGDRYDCAPEPFEAYQGQRHMTLYYTDVTVSESTVLSFMKD